MIYINSINFNIMQIIYYKNISHVESKSASHVLLKLIEFIDFTKPKSISFFFSEGALFYRELKVLFRSEIHR
jgi:hypothetical protein